ncbi:MAG: putative zinc-binding metallopeptidase [Hyphomonadaceae bacterium]
MASNLKVRSRAEPHWTQLSDADLLCVRIKDLGLTLEGTWLADALDDLNGELERRELKVRAHGWLSDEWFSPHSSPGVAFPFYLAHPRLMQLERKMVLEVEGGTRRDCMRILRHEAGHVMQRAYGLHRRRRWRQLFGHASRPYPEHYRPNPTSKNYVQHLRRWYAQCHPDEDFAETFAVWLTPRSNWRRRYAEWPVALAKLEYVEELMAELAGAKPLLTRKIEIDPVHTLRATLGEHYEQKTERYAIDTPTVFDRDLKRIFSDEPGGRGAPQAAAFIKRHRATIRDAVSRRSGEYLLTLDAAIDDMIDRCRALKLRAPRSERKTRADITALLTKKAVTSHYSARRQSFAV